MRFTGPVLICGCLFLAGCGQKKEPALAPGGAVSAGPSNADKLTHSDPVVGTGATAANGDTVWVQYRGTLKNGTEFDSNMTKDKDVYSFMIGQGAVIKGWDQGVPGMRVGGERLLHVPASLGYGANAQSKIPANSDLEFDIKLLGDVKPGEDAVIDCSDLKVGTGREATYGDTVTIQYVGSLLNGRVFEDSHYFKKPYALTIGKGNTLSCIDEGVRGMRVGGKRRIVAPPSTAYVGKANGKVPADSEVVFVVDLVSMK